ncbi:hypothetical protein [Hirschia litorea]|uniref:Secreted protein n=1 Tax=Hirschia litorea TaxID=1199156 RepID=A0ABW2IK57_9PROT
MKLLFNSIIYAMLVAFTVTMLFLRLTTGSFEEAGARVDRWTGNAAGDLKVVAAEAADQASVVAKDIADGPDGTGS